MVSVSGMIECNTFMSLMKYVAELSYPTRHAMRLPSLLVAVACVTATLGAQTKRLPQPGAPYVPSPQSVVDAMLELAHVTSADVVYDLGSGDGRIPITAALRYGARGVGVEIDKHLVDDSITAARRAHVDHLVTFFHGDLFEADITPATVV